MRAVARDSYGGPEVLRLTELDVPRPAAGEVLVRVAAAGVGADEWHLLRGLPYASRLVTGLTTPKNQLLGLDLAGVVVGVGEGVTEFAVGDEVFGWSAGAYAEYVAVPANQLLVKPHNLSLAEAAVVPISGFTALQALRDAGQLKAGQRVLINGASGGVGSFAVQIAKALGAHVTGVASSRNQDFVRSLGADEVIDYTREDFTEGPARYDLIVDLAQSHSLEETRRALTERGSLVLVGSSARNELSGRLRWFKGTDRWFKALFLSLFSRQRLVPLVHEDKLTDLAFLRELIEAGKLRPVVTQRFGLGEVRRAIAATEGHSVRGKLVIEV
ncbi:MAG: NAD(P)-dependent alcohol dehydrogenase [Polyangiaceae bacterium]|nr:NAD(P)-dependent alcohol dehydrogenase [Myxococcales bacterium]MCB9586221.1 NAD(P)-dependent alcohol dehydrogenase [Polyangiaceae bacterium]MCB9606898.1 NAD(P)-dependent alcohol dehydrogenase [Polyangiaceae bacterium]